MTTSRHPSPWRARRPTCAASGRIWRMTHDFAALHDHARLPWRFFGRFTASIAAGLR